MEIWLTNNFMLIISFLGFLALVFLCVGLCKWLRGIRYTGDDRESIKRPKNLSHLAWYEDRESNRGEPQ